MKSAGTTRLPLNYRLIFNGAGGVYGDDFRPWKWYVRQATHMSGEEDAFDDDEVSSIAR
jgi:hypothetical protein